MAFGASRFMGEKSMWIVWLHCSGMEVSVNVSSTFFYMVGMTNEFEDLKKNGMSINHENNELNELHLLQLHSDINK